jgi:hypothetical protein
LDFEISAVKTFVVVTAQALQCAKPKLGDIAIVRFAVVHDFGRDGAAFDFAHLAQRV